MTRRAEKSTPLAASSLYFAIGLLFLLMPYIAVLKHGFPLVKLGDSSLTALVKDVLIVYVIAIGVPIILSAKNCFKVDTFEATVCLLLILAATKTIISTATPLQALTSFRHEFLFTIFALVLYRLCRIGVLQTASIQRIFSKILALNLIVVVLIGYFEIANKEILEILYGEQAMNLVTGIPGIPQIRSVSTLENPINFALFLTLCVTYFSATAPRVTARHIFIAAAALPLLLATFSRIFVVLYSLILITLLVRYYIRSTIVGKISLGALVIAATITALNAISSTAHEIDIYELIEARIEQTVDGIQSRDDPRFDNWDAAFKYLNSFPVVGPIGGLGLGVSNPGNFEQGQFRIENSFLTIYLQLGVLGLLLFLMPTGMAILLILKKKMPAEGGRSLAIVLIILLGGLTNDSHRNMPFSFYLWICLALSMLTYKYPSDNKKGTA